MKLIIRLVVLIVVALFLFTGGFWLGNQWKGESAGFPDGDSLAKIAGKEQAAPVPENSEETPPKDKLASDNPGKKLIESEEKAPPAKAPNKPEETVESSPEPAPSATEAATENAKKEASPPLKNEDQAASKIEVTEPQEKIESPPGEPKPSSEKAAPEAEPANGMPRPEQEEQKESLALIVTPEDLGKNKITYSVQVGTFLEKDLARIRLEQLKAKQYPAFMISAWDNQKQLWYTVRVGRYTDIMKAQMAAKEITKKERIPATVYGLGSLRYEDVQEPIRNSPEDMAPAGKKPGAQTNPPEN